MRLRGSLAEHLRCNLHKISMFALLVSLMVAMPAQAASPIGEPSFEPDVYGGYSSDRIIVRFRDDVMRQAAPLRNDVSEHGEAAAAAGVEPVLGEVFHEACARWGVSGIRKCFGRAFGDPGLASDLALDRTYIIEVPPGSDALEMADAFNELPEVESAGTVAIGGIAEFIPDDPDFEEQYNFRNTGQTGGTAGADVRATEAWEIHTGIVGSTTLAVIDSGVSLHNDYAAHVIGGTNTASPGSTNLTDITCPHGTHVTGIAAAIGNNGNGVAGMTWGANILRIRALNGCNGVMDPVADGIIWATDQGADVINISLQYYGLSQTELGTFENSVEYAYQQGVLIVAAAGNNAGFNVAHPAEFENVMAVAATDDNDNRAGFSNQGLELDVAAPGDLIWSTYPNPANSYNYISGTSMASPLVAGLACLLKSYLPGATNEDLWSLIEDNVVDLGSTGHDINFGHGRVDAYASMAAAAALPRVESSEPGAGYVDARQPFNPDGSSPDGLSQVELTFTTDPTGLGVNDFTVTEELATAEAPGISSILITGDDTAEIFLDGPISPGGYTQINHRITATGATLGYLPGDVNSDGTTDAADRDALLSAFGGLAPPFGMHQIDINRDETVGPEDILRHIDLLNGGGEYDAWFGVSLPE